MPFTCSICGEKSTRICERCTKDACDNHLCEKCLRCSDCCECEVTLSEPVRQHRFTAETPVPRENQPEESPASAPSAREPQGEDTPPNTPGTV
jgi:hypothetical protein